MRKMEVDIYDFIENEFKKLKDDFMTPIKIDLAGIQKETKATNGRVSKLETFKACVWTGGSIIIVFVGWLGWPEVKLLLSYVGG